MRKMFKKGLAFSLSLVIALSLFQGVGPATVKAASASGVAINATNFPDSNFKSYVTTNYDKDSNGYLSDSEIASATDGSTVKSCGASDLTGLEYLTGLTTLDCTNMGLDSINVKNNWALQTLKLTGNDFTELDIWFLKSLTTFEADTDLTYMAVDQDDWANVPQCVKNFINTLTNGSDSVLDDTLQKMTSLDIGYYYYTGSAGVTNVGIVDSYDFELGDEFVTFIPVYEPDNSYVERDFKYYLSDDSIVSMEVDEGKSWNEVYLTPVKSGTTTLYMETMDGSRLKSSIEIVVAGGVVDVPVTGLTLDQTSLDLTIGNKRQLKATISPADATDTTVKWSSNMVSVASVDAYGNVTANSVGEAVITAKSAANNNIYAVCNVTVSPVLVTTFQFHNDSISVNEGATCSPTYTLQPGYATNPTLNWSSNNTSVATVNSSGVITGVSPGTATITAKTTDGSNLSDTIQVIVNEVVVPVTGVDIPNDSLNLTIGGTSTLTATVSPGDAINKTIRWTSADTSVATVDESTGKVTAKGIGSTTITATATDGSGCKDTITVTVSPIYVTGITIGNQPGSAMKKGETVKLTATVAPANATFETVTWSTSNASLATVAADGTVTIKGDSGNASNASVTITATAIDGSNKSASVTITIAPIKMESFSVSPSSATIMTGKTTTLTITNVYPSNTTMQTVTWKSDNTSVATVDSATGMVTAVKAGTATITATAADGSDVTATCQITVLDEVVAVTDIYLGVFSVNMNVDDEQVIKATLLPHDATDKQVVWKNLGDSAVIQMTISSDTSQCSIRGMKPGKTTIIAKAVGGDNVVRYLDVTVSAIAVTGVTIEGDASLTMKKNESKQLTATVAPSNATYQDITWTSSDSSIVSVDQTGYIKVLKDSGSTETKYVTITATSDSDSSMSASVTIAVVPTKVTGFSLSQTSAALTVGKTVDLDVKNLVPADATVQTVTWTSSNPAVATVTTVGLVNAVANGTAVITATADDGSGVKATCTVTVQTEKVPVQSITLSKTALSLNVGKSATLTATVLPSNATNKALTWTTSNSGVVTVSGGVVKAVAAGTATVTALAKDGSGIKATCKVTVTKLNQTITGPKATYKKAYGAKAFNLQAKTSGNGKLTYVSSKPKVAKVDGTGKVTIVGTGKTVITITAAATNTYNKATKKVTIIVKPKKAVLKKLTSPKKKVLKVVWAKDTMANGYEVVIGTNKKCTKNKQVVNIKKMKTTSTVFKKLKSKTVYYVKVRSYVTIDGKKVYGKYSKVMKLKVK